MRFEKWHALGNAYLLVERPDGGEVTAARVRRLCDVRHGIGADGLLVATSQSTPDVVLRITPRFDTMLRLLDTGSSALRSSMEIEGDAALAATVGEVAD